MVLSLIQKSNLCVLLEAESTGGKGQVSAR